MSEQKAATGEDIPEPAREALEQPHLAAEELEHEIGESDPWDEASEDPDVSQGPDPPAG